MASTGVARGEAADATVSTIAPDAEARARILETIRGLEDGPVKDRLQAMADLLTTPQEALHRLADEAEAAAADIQAKIDGMEKTRKERLADAKAYRQTAKEMD